MTVPVIFMRMCFAKNKAMPLPLKIWVGFLMTLLGWIMTPIATIFFGLFYCQVFFFCIFPGWLKYICMCTCFYACAGALRDETRAANENEHKARRKLGWPTESVDQAAEPAEN